MLAHGIAIEHACEEVSACATRHVRLPEAYGFIPAADNEEETEVEDQLDDTWGLDSQSHLSCCMRVKGPAVVVELPRYSKNPACEG